MAVDKETQALLSSRVKEPFGTTAPEAAAQRTITITPTTKYVNVERWEVVRFLVDGKSFTWNFYTLGTPIFEMAAIAPKDINVGKVVVYVQKPYFDPTLDS
ncbi:MAG TPA: hypothetical protein DHV59_10280 [Oxalobacteraceae bacterium]|nr:hypothetical protein [Oxalobacteraceae bacterium]